MRSRGPSTGCTSEAVRLASNEAALRGNVNAMFVNLSRR